ncbi:hypothetical protein [Streptosporangium sp. NBC_01469]|uniref:hypothetical protein n=1 Tax=Streptosporangium sp. NBC_01469 TaxID=2903898 RepID=UPI002E2AD80E|nr:hypothetical protein [Streptosporangium sp. NBC_01469]
MDPILLILEALAVGAATGLTDAANVAVKDAYLKLKEGVLRRLGDSETAKVTLAEHEKAPEVWRAPLQQQIEAARIADDDEILELAQEVLALKDPQGAHIGKYVVDARGSQGVQIGERASQVNRFGTGPRSQS